MDGPWICLVTPLVVIHNSDTLTFMDDTGLSMAPPDMPGFRRTTCVSPIQEEKGRFTGGVMGLDAVSKQ